MVLPFAGIELFLLFLALRAIDRQASDYESIHLDDDSLVVSTRHSAASCSRRFQTAWARVTLEPGDSREPLVCIRSHGHSAHVGRLLTPDQRRQLFSDLSSRLARPH